MFKKCRRDLLKEVSVGCYKLGTRKFCKKESALIRSDYFLKARVLAPTNKFKNFKNNISL